MKSIRNEVLIMLYKKNGTKSLDMDLFKNPTAEYRGTPFWSWNNKLDKEQLLRQIEELKKMGFGGFHMHCRTGLETEYLGDEFMGMVKACCDKAEEEDMLAWLYDEDRWSSGFAGGLVTKNKKFRRKHMMFSTQDEGWNGSKSDALEKGENYLLAVYDVTLDNEGYLEKYSRINRGDKAAGTKYYAYCSIDPDHPWYNNQEYVDSMDKEAMAEFIRVTYDRYKEVVGDRFDKSVPAIFTDEPNVNSKMYMFSSAPENCDGAYSWSRYFEENYQKTYGEDILDKLPELVWKKADGSDSELKYKYFNFIAQGFSESFSGQIGKWCDENGIAFTGHYLREPKLYEQSNTCGEVMRNYGKMTIPGIDILCSFKEYTTAKQTQSAVHQYGKEGMMSELYGVTNWDFDFRGHKIDGDWQAALGVTVRVPHLAWVSMKGESKRDYPSAIGYQVPWYKEYPYVEDHFARLNTALTRGKPIIKIGVIHPVESCWISMGPASQTMDRVEALEEKFKNITEWLIKNHLDFNFICESTLPELSDKSKPANVGKMAYEAIVVPACITLRTTTIEFLDNFRKNGGKVIFMGQCPTHIDGVRNDGCKSLFEKCTSIDFDKASLQEALKNERVVSIQNSKNINETRVIYNYRQDNDCRWLFIACCEEFGQRRYAHPQRDVTEFDEMTITVYGEFIPTEYDTITGEIKPMNYVHKNGKTVIKYEFIAFNSILMKLSDKAEAEEVVDEELKLVKEYTIKNAVDYTLDEGNVLILDQAEYKYDDGEWQESEEILHISSNFRKMLDYSSEKVQPYAMSIAPEEHTVSLRFEINSEIEVKDALLALEDAKKAQITFNGKKVDNNIVGYFTDESINTIPLPTVNEGKNILEIVFPYGERTYIEWCFILGKFGVRVAGCEKTITKAPEKLGFGSVTTQLMPFYGANINYTFDVELENDGAVEIEASYYRGSLIGVSLDGERCGRIVYPPYVIRLDNLKKGKHTVTLTLFGNRHNSFGTLHRVNKGAFSNAFDAWRTNGKDWGYEYNNLKRLGILKSPIIRIYSK